MVGDGTWLTVGEAADRLDHLLSKQTVRRYADDGRLVSRRLLGKHRRISAASVEELRRTLESSEGDDTAADS